MNDHLTDITLVVDRSGSMQEIQSDAEGGINTFVAKQAQEPGDALLTLVEFDTQYEFVHRGVPLAAVPRYELVPRGMTALLDAVGQAINQTGERLASMPEAERPGLVVFVIVTDGRENSSREFTKAQIKSMIEKQQKEFSWHFTYLGADQDAFAEAGGMGIRAAGSANFSKSKIGSAYAGTTSKISRMRIQKSSGQAVVNEYTEEERDEMS